MEDSHLKIKFTFQMFISFMELKQFTYYVRSFSYVKLHVRFLYRYLSYQKIIYESGPTYGP